jgi:hypothetical protein
LSSARTCHDCGAAYRGSQTAGGHCTACHQSFRSQGAFDKHRTGAGDERRCRAGDELAERGMIIDDIGQWRYPPPEDGAWLQQRKGPAGGES